MQKLVDSPQLRSQLSEARKERVQQFDWERKIDRIVKISNLYNLEI